MSETLSQGGPTPPVPGTAERTLFDALVAVQKNNRAHSKDDIIAYAEETELDIPEGLLGENKSIMVAGLMDLFKADAEEPMEIIDTTPAEPEPEPEAEPEAPALTETPSPAPKPPAPRVSAPVARASAPRGPRKKTAKAKASGRYHCCGGWVLLEKGQKVEMTMAQYEHLKRVGKVH